MRQFATPALAAVLAAAFSASLAHAAEATPGADSRRLDFGLPIPDEGYCDQPYVVILPDGAWLCTLTTGPGREGQRGQHIVSTRSTDQGRTWSRPVDIEPSDGPEASWVVPLVTPGGRVYAFYTYNGDDVRSLDGKPIRADTIGHYASKYSDDGGRSWSARRTYLPLRLTACDRGNDWQGGVQIFWGIDKPTVDGDAALFAFTKLGKYMLEQGEGWLFRSDNILSETDPAKIRWQLLPDGEHGLRGRDFGSVQEEHNVVALSDGSLYCVWRTTLGFPACAYSRDGGRSWTEPEPMAYAPGGRMVKTPRACPKLWRTAAGKFLFWFHNHSGKSFLGRNPAWVSGGVEKDGYVHWSEPEILLYDPDPNGRMSYPDLIEQDGRYWVTETNKTVARVHEIDRTLLEGMWESGQTAEVTRRGLLVDVAGEGLASGRVAIPGRLDLTQSGGLTVGLWVRCGPRVADGVLVDSRDDQGRGLSVETTAAGAMRIGLSDGRSEVSWESDPGVFKSGGLHHVAAIVDDGPQIIRFVVDGTLSDGGTARDFGWGRYAEPLGDVTASGTLRITPPSGGQIQRLRLYTRPLRTAEAVANHHAGP